MLDFTIDLKNKEEFCIKKRILILLLMLALSFSCVSFARDVMSDTWTFVDDLYDEEGRLLSCEVGSYSIKASVSAVAVDIQRWRPEGAKSAKLMILSDEIGSIAPITHSVEF